MPTPHSLLFSAAAGLAIVPIHAFADDSAADPVIISATQTPTPQSQVASSVSVITGDAIDLRQQRTLPDVLKLTPGLNLVQSGGLGGQTTIFMRGTNSNHTKVFVDGIDVSDPSSVGGNFDFGQLQTQDIERIEVLRGPQSGLYGSDAIGGVINVITRSGSGPLQAQALAEAGSFDTFNQSASLRGSSNAFHYSATVEHLHAGATPVTPLNLLAPGERRIDDYDDNLTASTKLGYDISNTLDVGFVGRYTDGHLRFTGDDFDPVTFASFPASRQSEAASTETYTRAFGHQIALNGLLDQTLSVAYSRKRTANYTAASGDDAAPPVSLDTGYRIKYDWRGALKLAQTETLVLGAEHDREEISEPLSASTKVSSGYAELQSRLWDDFSSAVNIRYDDNSRFGSKVTYRLAPTYLISATDTRLKASVGTGFKAPTLGELFQDFPAFQFFANPNLKPESSTGFDVGFEQTLLNGKVTTGATYFHNHLRDLISTLTDPVDFNTNWVNVGRATTLGVESFVAYQPMSSLTLRADYTFTQSTDDILHQDLLRRPKHKGSVDASWQALSRLALNATVLTVGSWTDVSRDGSIPRLAANGYTTVNLAAHYDLTAKVNVFARVENLFDRHFENPVGFMQAGIGAFAGVKVSL